MHFFSTRCPVSLDSCSCTVSKIVILIGGASWYTFSVAYKMAFTDLKIIYLQGASPDHALWHCRAFKQCCHTSLLMLHVASLGGYIEKHFVCNLLCNNFWVIFCYADWICFWSKQNLTSFKILLKPNSFNILQSQHVLVESAFNRIP